MHIDVHYISMVGSLSFGKKLEFEGTFPGRVLRQPLVMTNKYGRSLKLTSISSTDPRFVPVLEQEVVEAGQVCARGVSLGRGSFMFVSKVGCARIWCIFQSPKLSYNQQRPTTSTFVGMLQVQQGE